MAPSLRLPLALATAALAACGTDFDPQSYLDDARILAVVSDPTEVGPGETVTLTPTVYAPEGDPVVATAWTFCPLNLGAAAAFACAVTTPACEVALTPAPDGTVTADPSALVLACLESLGGSPPPGEGSGEIPAVLETAFTLRIETAGGRVREGVTRVPLHTGGPPATRNQAPVITGVELGGVPAAPNAVGATIPAGGEVAVVVRVDPASLEVYQDGNGRTIQETVVVSFFATAGRFDNPRASAPDAENVLVAEKLEAGQDHADVWVVALDLRGGQAVAGPFRVDFAP